MVIDYDDANVSSMLPENYRGLVMLTQYLIDLNHIDIFHLHRLLNYITVYGYRLSKTL